MCTYYIHYLSVYIIIFMYIYTPPRVVFSNKINCFLLNVEPSKKHIESGGGWFDQTPHCISSNMHSVIYGILPTMHS